MKITKTRSQVWQAFREVHSGDIKTVDTAVMVTWLNQAFWSLFQDEEIPKFSEDDVASLDTQLRAMLKQVKEQRRKSRDDGNLLKKSFMEKEIIIDFTGNGIDMTEAGDIDMTGDGDIDIDMTGGLDNGQMDTDQDQEEEKEDQEEEKEDQEEEEEEDELEEEDDNKAEDEGVPGPSTKRPFSAKRPRTKRHIAQILREVADDDQDALFKALCQVLRKKGHSAAANSIEKIQQDPDEVGKQIKKYLDKTEEEEMSVIASLALLLRNNLSQRSYKDIRTRTKNVLSSWHELDKLKAEIIPEGIVATRNNVMVPMQSMLNMTVSRILLDPLISNQIYKFKEDNGGEIKVYLIFKYGLDGNTGGMMPQNEGAYDDEDPELRRDPGKMLVSSMVALQLIVIVDHVIEIVYSNGLYNSNFSVRPLRHWYVAENDITLGVECARLDEEVENLEDLDIGNGIKVGFLPIDSCNDMKIVSFKMKQASSRCSHCGATPSERQDPNLMFRAKPEALALMCVSVLHFGPRTMENFLNIGFRQDFEAWQRRTPEQKELAKERKKIIQANFKRELSLAICEPRSGGLGSSNTGNTARKAFNHPHFFAVQIIKNPDQNVMRVARCSRLITMTRNIWIVLRSCMKVNVDKLQDYCDIARKIYEGLWDWYPMSPTLHKVLCHIREIIQYFPPTITSGMLSEEATETANKDIKNFIEHHAPQHDLTARNLSVFTRFIVRSDPEVLAHEFPRKITKSNQEEYPEEVREMLEEVSVIYYED